MLTEIAEFDREWTEAQASVLSKADDLLTAAGGSADLIRYVRDLKGYPRIPYFSALWVPSRDRRVSIGAAVCLHAIGIKLLDDLLDQDQPYSRWDQALGVFLIQSASALLAQHANAAAVMESFARDYEVIWRMQLAEAATPPVSLMDWIAYARVKSGRMMANYAEVACVAGAIQDATSAARDFAESVGVLFMIGDDLRDFDTTIEMPGNLSLMMARGVVAADELTESITEWSGRAVGAMRSCPPVHDLSPFISEYARRLCRQMASQSRR